MKKIIIFLMVFILTLSCMTGCGAAEQAKETSESFVLTMQIGNPVMTVNGEETNIDNEGTVPTVENGRTLVPIRAIIEAMGGKVDWQADTNTAVLTLNGDTVKLTIGSKTAYFNENQSEIDVEPKIINDRTMLPIRYIAESFKFEVDWSEETQTITITKNTFSASETAKTETKSENKVLVVYYSATGSTEKVANYIKDTTGADIFKLEPANEYTSADLNYNDENSRVCKEHDDEKLRDVELKITEPDNWSEYDTVYIGYPIWWGIAAWPVNNFVKNNDFTGKTVIPFCTSASSSIGQSGELLADMAGTGDWQTGMRFRSGASENDVKEWLDTLK